MRGVKRNDWPAIEAAWEAGTPVREILARFPDLSPWTLSSRVQQQGLTKRSDYRRRPIVHPRQPRRFGSTSPWRRSA